MTPEEVSGVVLLLALQGRVKQGTRLERYVQEMPEVLQFLVWNNQTQSLEWTCQFWVDEGIRRGLREWGSA